MSSKMLKETMTYEELKESDLPIALQGKSEPQIKLYLSKKREERKNIQDQIQFFPPFYDKTHNVFQSLTDNHVQHEYQKILREHLIKL